MSSSSSQQQPETIYLADYLPPAFLIDSVDLKFELDEETTRVESSLKLRRNRDEADLVLDGEELELVSLRLDGRELSADEYAVDEKSLRVKNVPDAFTLEVVTHIHPAANTSLGGLYTSGGNFCTQCEAEDFRRITYYLDRPDVMARFSTHISADKAKYPVLLSNGNLMDSGELDSGELDDGRHWAQWQDPFPKPCYLFALVAGDLACIQDTFTTCSGRDIDLRIYVQHHNKDKCDHAMRSLKNAMAWDEKTYGREYDLDLYMVVAVDDFNMGAMENKGLNVFNSCYVLARQDTATDTDYLGIESVIGHEYFHNWSGNRVTCRDWFQLSLKEGFTVFRDQEFSADLNSRGVQRIQDVNVLRTHQFREDAGPMAHAVRTDSYVEINNFYTVTVYNKGAEVVRMQAHLAGPEGFRKGTDLYFERHDGQAVTTDDFVQCIQEASGKDLSQFKRWYSQAGTPVVSVAQSYDGAQQEFTLKVRQHCPATPGQTEKQPFHIPLAVGLLDEQGNDLPLQLKGSEQAAGNTLVLDVTEAEQSFTFTNIPCAATPSLLREFSAPVKIEDDLTDTQRYFLMAHDSDPFNRWEAGQQMGIKLIGELVQAIQNGMALALEPAFVDAYRKTLLDDELDAAMKAEVLRLPSEAYLAEFADTIDPVAIHEARLFVRRSLAEQLRDEFMQTYEANNHSGEFSVDAQAIGKRSLKNTCLGYLMELEDQALRDLCWQQFSAANNMTDVMTALSCFSNTDCKEREQALADFYAKWKDEVLVVNKWLNVQATSRLPSTFEEVKQLTQHEAFSIKNPNKVRALVGAFCNANPLHFHAIDGSGYAFLREHIVQLNELNPQIAARMCTPLTQWRRYDEKRQALMKQEMETILATEKLSPNVYEVISKSLEG